MKYRPSTIPVLIRAEITGVNAAGQARVHILANGADGITFLTDSKSMIFTGGRDVVGIRDVISALESWEGHTITDAEAWHLRQVIGDIKSLPRVDLLEGQT